LEVYRRPAGYDPSRGSIKAWLAIKTKSRSLDRLRKQQRVVVAEPKENRLPVFMNPALSTEETVLSKVEREVLERAMERIPGAQKQALSEKFFDSRTQKEIAVSMERPVGTVKSLIRYGIRNVRKQLRQLGWSDPSSKGGGSRGL
jgi:RNA polymerase sigma-70 factor (ECF subfamily)